ncbi:MAG: lysophospholipid acyltransferase family protein [Thiohalomonadaceae bacterium]|jgi:1-acyl-sn-glycerol-3-phosphate acyltransferase
MPPIVVLPYRLRYRLLTRLGHFVIWWLAITCKLHYRISGQENIPSNTAIILAKHQSAWETFALQLIFPPQTWVLKRSLFYIPIFGWGLMMLKAIGIDRAAGRKALQQVVQQGTARLNEGIWVVIFPEGTRTAPGERRKYNIGAAVLAKKSGYPIVPVAHNAGVFWPRNSILKHAGTIDVVIGPVIYPTGKGSAEINDLAESWIEATQLRLDSTPDQPRSGNQSLI